MDVFGLGACVVDQFGLAPAFAHPDAKCELAEWRTEFGGPVATALVALARWGRRCAFAGVVGDDDAGAAIRANLRDEGIDDKNLLTREGAHSQRAFIAVETGTARRTIYWRRPTAEPPRRSELSVPAARLYLTDGLFGGLSAALARDAACTVVDAGTLRDGTRELIPEADVFVASESFARAYAGDADGCCRKLREAGVEVAAVTLGSRGYVASFGRTRLERPAVPVDAVDTTGCGDVFHAGVCQGILEGWDWEKTFDFANWAAAQAATALGGRAAIPPWQNGNA